MAFIQTTPAGEIRPVRQKAHAVGQLDAADFQFCKKVIVHKTWPTAGKLAGLPERGASESRQGEHSELKFKNSFRQRF